MLLDEPTGFLDLAHQVSLIRFIRQLCHEQGKTVVMVAHDLNLIQGTATHVMLMGEDGAWQAGEVSVMMDAEKLAWCLGYPVTVLHHDDRPVYVPGGGL
jgi:iron complex transport system ATP-binding protein